MNDKYKLLLKPPQYCKRLFGVKIDIFENLLGKVQKEIDLHLEQNPLSRRGADSDFSTANQLLLTLEYLRQYPTFLSLGFSYGVSEGYANRIYHRIRPILAKVVGLKNPERISFKQVSKVLVDVTAQPIERPKAEQKKYYNRFKKNT